MKKLQFEVRFLVEVDASTSILEPQNLEEVTLRNDFIEAKARELQHTNSVFQSVRYIAQLSHGIKNYTEYISDLSIEAYRDILQLMQEYGYSEFDFQEHGVTELAQITYQYGYSTQLACEKIIVQGGILIFQGDDGNSYSLSELQDTDIFYILNVFKEGLSHQEEADCP